MTAGHDRLVGTGDDIIYGLAGDDTLRGGTGNDVLRGGPGDNTIIDPTPQPPLPTPGAWTDPTGDQATGTPDITAVMEPCPPSSVTASAVSPTANWCAPALSRQTTGQQLMSEAGTPTRYRG